jgi:uncharacterized protein (TIGR00730 family)
MHHTVRRIAVFCGSHVGRRPAYVATARSLGSLLVKRGIGLVYGGDRVGLMGVLARTVLEAGGVVTGVIPRFMQNVTLPGLSEFRVVETLHERKQLMADLSDGFIALPGGFGTLDEWFEVLTWAQLGQHSKPCGLLQVDGYYDHLLAMLEHAKDEGFIKAEHCDIIVVASDPEVLLDRMIGYSLSGPSKGFFTEI